MKNQEIPIQQRLKFLPNLAHFIMSFADLNKYVLPFNFPQNEYEEASNVHCKEDANHWPWYLHDLKTLELNNKQELTNTLRFIWCDDISPSRKLSYELIGLVSNQTALKRYVAIEVMESTGNVVFNVLNEITKTTDLELKFCSETHLRQETGHTVGDEENVFENMPITREMNETALIVVEKSFNAFNQFMDQLELNLKNEIKIN